MCPSSSDDSAGDDDDEDDKSVYKIILIVKKVHSHLSLLSSKLISESNSIPPASSPPKPMTG